MKECIVACGGLPFKGILHIGAHTGEEAKDYQDNGVQKVIWIEATPDYMDRLKEHTKQFTGLDQTYLNACLSDVDGQDIEFNVANNEHSNSMLQLGTHATMYPHIKYTKSIPVKTRRLDRLVEEGTVLLDENCDIINIDVQGAELMVFRGMGDLLKRDHFRAVYSEVNLEHVYEGCSLIQELDDYLKQFGFNRILTRCPEGTWGDALYSRIT